MRVHHQTNPLRVWHKLTQEPQLLWPKITKQEAHARGIATRAREGDGKPKFDRVIRDHEDNRNCRGRGSCGECRRRIQRGDHGNLSARELGSQPGQALVSIIAVAIVDHHVAAFEVALLGQTLSKNPDERLRQPARGKKGHHWNGGLLRACRQRPHRCCAAEQGDELAAFHQRFLPCFEAEDTTAGDLLHCGISVPSMSASGQKRRMIGTVRRPMSALPPKADK